MDKKEFKVEFKATLDEMFAIMEAKNDDYSKTSAFWNFELVEKLWIASLEKWILVRMCDKVARISTLIDQDAKVKDESIMDTLKDLANYSVILKIYLSSKQKELWKK